MNERLRITLLGTLQIKQGDRVITRFKSQKTGALLAYLAYHLHHMHSREVLIEIFWAESPIEAGRNSLSVALSTLRHQLEPPGTPANAVLLADRFSIGLNPAAITTDITEFEATIKAAAAAQSATERALRLADAVDLYEARLLPGFYEPWVSAAQEQTTALFLETVSRLIHLMEENGDLSGALRYARRAVVTDPLQEQAQQHLIRLLAATGQPGAALHQYKEMERLVEEEMGEEPSASLRALARQIEKQSGLSALMTLPTQPALSRIPDALPVHAEPPRGPVTMTFLMTEFEGLTQMRELPGDIFQRAQETVHALLRREFARYFGHDIAATGDARVAAFQSAGQALFCAVALQQALHEQPWPESAPLRMRIALHTGDVEYHAGAYSGLALHQTSRMLTTGHGGQILCSDATASLVRRELGQDVRLVDLGVWRMPNVPAPERLFQVDYPGMREQAFPPLSAEAGRAAHLPMRFTRFFGRDDEITHLVGMLRPDPLLPARSARLVTLTGSGGSGKTRLALEAAERLLDPFQGAVWFVPLADITDARLIADTILDSLRVARSPRQEALDQAVEALSEQSALLVMDNLEHLVEGGATIVQALLTRLPALTVLATSRRLLGIYGEQEFVVPPLVTPNGGETAEQLSLYESVQLFVDRAQAAMPHFQVTSGNAPAVAELCQRLEGIPLAIELAAARALVLTPGQMLGQLAQRFDFLVSRKRDTAERHRTLQAAVDWSYRLLTSELRRFFARLSVFRGGWTREAAEAVCEQPLALDFLAQLRECSLVLADEADGGEEIRFRMLESLREYAGEQLTSDQQEILDRRHAAYFVGLAEEAESGLNQMEQQKWLDRLENEHANLRAALQRGETDQSGIEASLRMAGSLYQFWRRRGYAREGLAWIVRALEKSPHLSGSLRAKALHGAGSLAFCAGEEASSRSFHEQELAIRREIGDKRGIANALDSLVYFQQGQARRLLQEQILALYQEIGDKHGIGGSLLSLGIWAEDNNDLEAAHSFYERALAVQKEGGYPRGEFVALTCLGRLARSRGDLVQARQYVEERLAGVRACGSRTREIFTLSSLYHLACEQGDDDTARRVQEQCQSLLSTLWNHRERAVALETLGRMAMRQGDHITASDLLQDSLTLMRQTGEQYRVAGTLSYLAEAARARGDYAEARRAFEEEASLRRLSSDPLDIACSLDNLGSVAQAEGDYTTARSYFTESLSIRREAGLIRAIAHSGMYLAGLAMAQGQGERAVRLWGAAESLRASIGLALLPTEQVSFETDLAAVRATLEEAAFRIAWAEGQAMTLEQTMEHALDRTE